MPEQRGADYYESGRATAPPGVCYISTIGAVIEGYNHPVAPFSLNLTDPGSEVVESGISSNNINNFLHQRYQTSPHHSNSSTPATSCSLSISSTASKVNVASNPFPSFNSPDCSVTSDLHKFFSVNNFPFNSTANNNSNNNSNNNNSNNNNNNFNNNNNNHQNIGNYYTDNFEFLVTSKPQSKALQPSYTTQDNFVSHGSEQHSVSIINFPKTSKPDSVYPKELSSYSACLFPSQQNQSKYTQDKEIITIYSDKNPKKISEVVQKSQKAVKDDPELSYNIEELQQFLSKCGTKIKITQDTGQDLVATSVLHYLQKRNLQENSSHDFGDLSQILASLGKFKPEDVSGPKKKETEDSKLMNDFLAKIILDQEEKKLKGFDEKKKALRKEFLDELGDGIEERKVKRDAMSHYQEDKNHHKKSSNYGDFNQWDFFGQQEIQHSNNHNRRGHFSFGGAHQPPNPGWNSMRMGIPRQTNPYYSNPHGHMMPAHAHSDYRYNQWNNPNHKNLPNVNSAHSQNTILPQAKFDKHHDVSNTKQDFNIPVGTTSDFSKFWTASRDLMHSTPSPIPEKFSRSSVHPELLTSTPHAMKSAPTLRAPPLASHPKTVVNPLSDLQMLVTNQNTEKPPQRNENFQQETVDLSAHSDMYKHKENSDEKSPNVISKDKQEPSSSTSVSQNKNTFVKSECSESEKPVALTSKNIEKSTETEFSTTSMKSTENSANSDKIVTNVTTVKESEHLIEEPAKSNDHSKKIEDPPISSKVEIILTQNQKSEAEKNEDAIEIQEEKKDVEKCAERIACSEANSERKSSKEDEKKSPSEAAMKLSGNEENSNHEKRKADEEFSASKKVCLEIEHQVDKRLEGVGEENSDVPKVTSTSADTKSTVNESGKRNQKKKVSGKSRFGRLSSGQSSSSERSLSGKKSKVLGNKEDSRKKFKKSFCDVMDRRGPFLHLEGSKESPSSVVIVNSPKGDDEDEKDKNLVKKQSSTATRSKHQNELDYRGRSRNGMFCSTLSARYDAHTTDHTWMCVFCKRGPHYNMLGDLFGPYIISRDENTAMCDFSGDEKDISDAQKRGGRNKKSLRSNNMVEHFQKMSKKLRRTQSCESCLTGMTVISDDLADEVRYEVWVHEQCAVWSPNVCLIGSRIIGMQEAIWSSAKVICSKCGTSGANIGCVYRNCPNRSHYSCAKESGWSLVQETFISTCPIHKPRLSLPSAKEQSKTL